MSDEKLASRMARLGSETAFDMLVKARTLEKQGQDIIHLELGEPDFNTPTTIVDAGKVALSDGNTHYCPPAGIEELREVIASHITQSRGVEVNADWIVTTPGAKPIMCFLMLALIEKGDEVIYPDPGFPIYESMIRFVGGIPVPIPLLEDLQFSFSQKMLLSKISSRTKLIIINSPQNPTGGIVGEKDLMVVADIAIQNDIMVLSDEIYSNVIYEGKHDSIASIKGMLDRTVILDGFSKAYSMTGWRLGFGVMRPDLQVQISKLVTNSVSCTPPFIQKAGVKALKNGASSIIKMVGEFRDRRDFLVKELNQIPRISCLNPHGAFYVFPNVKAFGKSSDEIEDYLLKEAGVALLSGTSFGKFGEGYLRISYANSIENLTEACRRIRKALNNL